VRQKPLADLPRHRRTQPVAASVSSTARQATVRGRCQIRYLRGSSSVAARIAHATPAENEAGGEQAWEGKGREGATVPAVRSSAVKRRYVTSTKRQVQSVRHKQVTGMRQKIWKDRKNRRHAVCRRSRAMRGRQTSLPAGSTGSKLSPVQQLLPGAAMVWGARKANEMKCMPALAPDRRAGVMRCLCCRCSAGGHHRATAGGEIHSKRMKPSVAGTTP